MPFQKLLVSFLLFFANFLIVQPNLAQHHHRSCGFDVMRNKQRAINPDYDRIEQHYKENVLPSLASSNTQHNRSANVVLTIPVVVHVIHSGEPVGMGSNISDARIQAQLDILNEDYGALNENYNSTPARWQDVVGNPEIEFCLASVDPQGNPTNGITRHNIPVTGDINNSNIETVIKPETAWDASLYYNIYVLSMPGTNAFGGILGYSFLPYTTVGMEAYDGTVIDYNWFGGDGFGQSGDKTLTHETGHYLGLFHPFDGESCNSDDGLSDTPNMILETSAYAPNLGCGNGFPTGPTSCTEEHMYINYMDYANDERCYTSFSQQQVNVMRAVLSPDAWQYGFTSRASLVESAAVACGAVTCPDIMLVAEVLAADCGNTGSAVASASGGTEPYTYAWSNGSTSATLSGVASGNYALTVVDADDCEQVASVFIPAETLVFDISVTDESMLGANDGAISVNNVTGGMSPYFYQWSTGANTASITNLSGGDYVVTITSENGCSVSETIMVNITMACPGFVVDYVAHPASCAGSCDGGIELFLPSPNYTVSWSANVPSGEPVNLCSDTYLATITDPNGCIEILEIFVEEPTALEAGVDYTIEPLCTGDESGSIAVFAEGGTGEHTFFWSNGNTGSGAVLTSLPAGEYSVTIYDENECSTDVNVNLEEPS